MLKDLINKILDEIGLESLINENEDYTIEEEFHSKNDGSGKRINKKHP